MDKTYVFNSDGGANGFANSVLPLLQQRGIDPAILLNGNNSGFGGGGWNDIIALIVVAAHFYFAIQHYWIEEIEGKMQSLGASRKVLDRVVRNMRKNEMNTGFTYSKPSKRESIVVVGRSSSGGEFLNSSTHEIRHLVDDIAKEDNMPMSGEGVAYLTGDIVNQLADIISKFSCECCRNE